MPANILASIAVLLWNVIPDGTPHIVLGSVYVFVIMHQGRSLFARGSWRLSWGETALIALAAISCLGTLLFYLNSWNDLGRTTALMLLPWLIAWLRGKGWMHSQVSMAPDLWPKLAGSIQTKLVSLAYLSLSLATFVALLSARTELAIRTPWAVVPPKVFALYLLLACFSIAIARIKQHPLWLAPFYLVTLGVLPLIYPLGYGFDPFLHLASVKLLDATGTIDPKPFYYLGQYTLITSLKTVFGLPLQQLNTWLVPALASLGLPYAFTQTARAFKVKQPLLLAVIPLVVTLPFFTYTTPQGLAYLWALLAALAMVAAMLNRGYPAALPWVYGCAALAAHPLTGIPLLGITALWFVLYAKPSLAHTQSWLKPLLALGTVLAVPIAFMALSWLNVPAAAIAFRTDTLSAIQEFGARLHANMPVLPRYIDLADGVYLWGKLLPLAALALAALGFARAQEERSVVRFFVWSASLSFSSYLILALLVRFPGLPGNEQTFYTERLAHLGWLLLMPAVLSGAGFAVAYLQTRMRKVLGISVGALLLAASWYLSYPRFDLYHRDTAYNTTPSDIAAVRMIDTDAASRPYIVLANQAVAAAAVQEFGFSSYYQGNFYYPLPTGVNPLYPMYLQAAETGSPTRELMQQAAETAGVRRVYLVLNQYWANFYAQSAIATREASTAWSVKNGYVKVFRYDF